MKPLKPKPEKDKKLLTLFIMIVPSLMLAMTSAIPGLIVRIGFQLLLLLFQIVLFKNFIDDYYGVD